MIDTNQVQQGEERLTASGVTRVYEVTRTLHRDARGHVLGVIAVSRDVTERKGEEDARRQQQALLRIAGRAARLGGWSIEVASREVSWSEEVCAIHDEPPGFQPSLTRAITYYRPEDRQQVAELVETCIADGTPFDFECELHTATGRRIWVRTIGEAVRDPQGRIESVQGAFQDISDRKRAEDDRRRLADRLTTTLESITDGFFTLDRDWRFTYVNAEADRLILRDRAHLLGVTPWAAFPETLGSLFEHEYRRRRSRTSASTSSNSFPHWPGGSSSGCTPPSRA